MNMKIEAKLQCMIFLVVEGPHCTAAAATAATAAELRYLLDISGRISGRISSGWMHGMAFELERSLAHLPARHSFVDDTLLQVQIPVSMVLVTLVVLALA